MWLQWRITLLNEWMNHILYLIPIPPIGAVNVHATPTAHAAASISVLRDSFSYMPYTIQLHLSHTIYIVYLVTVDETWKMRCDNRRHVHERSLNELLNFNWFSQPSTSFPSGSPAPIVSVRPMNLAIIVRIVRYSLRITPRKMVLISGIPDPANLLIIFHEITS